MCIGWCADPVTLRSARCNDKDAEIYFKIKRQEQDGCSKFVSSSWFDDSFFFFNKFGNKFEIVYTAKSDATSTPQISARCEHKELETWVRCDKLRLLSK